MNANIAVIAILATALGCSQQASDAASADIEETPAAVSVAEAPAPPPKYDPETRRLGRDPGIYGEPAELMRLEFSSRDAAADGQYVFLISRDGEWITIDLETLAVAARGKFEEERPRVEALAGTVALVSLRETRDREYRGFDVLAGEYTDPPTITGGPRMEHGGPWNRTCGRKEGEDVAWSVPCRQEVVVARYPSLGLMWDEKSPAVSAYNWEDGTEAWTFEVASPARFWKLAAAGKEDVWLHYYDPSVSLLIAVDRYTGEFREAVHATGYLPPYDPSTAHRHPTRLWYVEDDAFVVLDLSDVSELRRETVPLTTDLQQWLEAVAREDDRPNHDARRNVAAVAHAYPEVVIPAIRDSSPEVVAKLIDALPSDVVAEIADGLVAKLQPKALTRMVHQPRADIRGREPLVFATVRRTFGQPPTPEWIETRTIALQQLVNRWHSMSREKSVVLKLDASFLRELNQETARWVTDADTSIRFDHRAVSTPGLQRLLDYVIWLTAVGTSTGGLSRPIFEAVAARSRPPICPRPSGEPESEIVDCSFAEPPEQAVVDGDVAAWVTVLEGLYGEVVVMRKVDGAWRGPHFAGVALGKGSWLTKQEPKGELEVEDRPNGVRLRAAGTQWQKVEWSDIERDSDDDGWTDILEELLGSDPKKADTDGDGSADPEDPMIGCSRSQPENDLQRLWMDAARLSVLREDELRPRYARFDPDECVEVPTLGGPLVLVDEAFLEERKKRVGNGRVRTWRMRVSTETKDVGEVIDALHESTHARWYTSEPVWRNASFGKASWSTWVGGLHGFEGGNSLFADVDGQWRPLGETPTVFKVTTE